jgi:hypothetical protein
LFQARRLVSRMVVELSRHGSHRSHPCSWKPPWRREAARAP